MFTQMPDLMGTRRIITVNPVAHCLELAATR